MTQPVGSIAPDHSDDAACVRGPPLLLAAAVGVVLVALLLMGLLVGRFWPGVQTIIETMNHSGKAGLLAFAAVQVLIAASGALPAALVGLAAGAVYGILAGFTLAATSTMAGAWLAFRLSRSLFRPHVERLLARRSRLARLDVGLARERWRLVCLMRVSPIMPFAATSYTLGLSAVSQRDYLLVTLAAMPALLGYVCVGNFAHAGLIAGITGAMPIHWVLLGLGILASVLLALRLGQVVARAVAGPEAATEAKDQAEPGTDAS